MSASAILTMGVGQSSMFVLTLGLSATISTGPLAAVLEGQSLQAVVLVGQSLEPIIILGP